MRRLAITPADGRDLVGAIRGLRGFDAVLIREPDLPSEALAHVATAALDRGLDVWLHGRNPHALDVARALGIGVHLPSGHAPVALPWGQSCHDGPALDRAFAAGARHALLSPVFSPTSKPDDRRPTLGPEGFLALARDRPVYALGGVTPERERLLTGAWGVALLGAAWPAQ